MFNFFILFFCFVIFSKSIFCNSDNINDLATVNFYSIELEGSSIATGFVLDSTSNYLITSAHIYGKYRYLCKTNYLAKGKACPNLYAINNFNKLLLNKQFPDTYDIDSLINNKLITDKSIDIAIIKFAYLEQTTEHKQIQINFSNFPEPENNIYYNL